MSNVYGSPAEALEATDRFYLDEAGFQYPEDTVTRWVTEYVAVPARGRALDLCCGDGIWSKGLKNASPDLELFGIDISTGAIEKARTLLGSDADHFVVGDAEQELPFPSGFFDLVFARGPGLYNQHDMDRPETIAVIERWHEHLTLNGRFYSIFASTPEKMGTYTGMEDVKLPYNRAPRSSAAVDFRGGKYHHTIRSFLTPFWKARNVAVVEYRFFHNLHVLVTKSQRGDEA